MELLKLIAMVAEWAPILHCYPVAVLAWRMSTREVTIGSIGCDIPLLVLLVLSAAATAAANNLGSSAGGAGPLKVVSLVAALAACARAFHRHIRGPRFQPVNMDGKLCVVTGANTGIGLETTRELARMGATVVMGCRSASKAKAAADDVIASTGCRPDQVQFIGPLDLSSLRSVKSFSEEFAGRYGSAAGQRQGLDVLICNAGLMQPHRVLTEDGIELTMAANHFGHFLLIQQLLPLLERSTTGGRVVNVGSALAHNAAKFAIDDVMSEKSYSMFQVYTQSKLANAMLTCELQRRLSARGSKVCANVLHPGTVHTEVTRNFSALIKFGYWISQPLMRLVEKTPAEGAYTSVHVATAPELHGVGGKYFVHCAPVQMPAAAEHVEQCEMLWELSQSITAKALAGARTAQ